MLSLLPFVLTASQRYELATVTRFYAPPADRRVSTAHVWLMSPDGRRRRVDRGEAWSGPAWSDPHHLFWTERRADREELWVATLPSLRRRRLATARFVRFEDDGVWLDDRPYLLKGGRIVPGQPPKVADRAAFGQDGKGYFVRWGDERYGISNPRVRWKVSMTSEGRRSVALDDLVPPFETRSLNVAGTPILRFRFWLSGHDALCLLVRLDRDTHVARVIPLDAARIEFDSGGRRFVALSGRRLEACGKLDLWTSSLFVGEAPSLRYRRVRLPFGYTTGVAFRP